MKDINFTRPTGNLRDSMPKPVGAMPKFTSVDPGPRARKKRTKT